MGHQLRSNRRAPNVPKAIPSAILLAAGHGKAVTYLASWFWLSKLFLMLTRLEPCAVMSGSGSSRVKQARILATLRLSPRCSIKASDSRYDHAMETSNCRCRHPQGLYYSSEPADADAMGERTTNAATRTTVTEVLRVYLRFQFNACRGHVNRHLLHLSIHVFQFSHHMLAL